MSKKQLERHSKKSTSEAEKNKKLVKKYIEQGDPQTAKIYAENAVRKKNESLNYLRMAGRLDATASRLQSAQQIKMVSKQMGTVVKGMEHAMASMNLEEISNIMDQFESQFEQLDVRTGVLEQGMHTATMTTAPEDQIDALLQEVGTEYDIDVTSALEGATVPQDEQAATTTVGNLSVTDENSLNARLAELRQ
eukprot:gene9674-1886_t